jgi:hypothetical protein
MTNNSFNTTNTGNYDAFPKQFFNYINYELSLFEKITTNKKFFFNIVSNINFDKVFMKQKKKKMVTIIITTNQNII